MVDDKSIWVTVAIPADDWFYQETAWFIEQEQLPTESAKMAAAASAIDAGNYDVLNVEA